MRPRLVQTLKDLKDFIVEAERNGAKPDTNIWTMRENGGYDFLKSLTGTLYTDDDCIFITFDHWSEAELYMNALHSDDFGVEDSYIS